MSTTTLAAAGRRPRVVVEGLPVQDRCLVMGVVNVTPDSFSDGGHYFAPREAIRRGLAQLAAGADLLDIGGESTRPGAQRVPAEEEWRRLAPVLHALTEEGACVSVDTTRAAIAARALDLGVAAVNDVSGGLADPDMYRVVAGRAAAYVCMHWRAHSATMQQHAAYDDVVEDVRAELRSRLDAAVHAGVNLDRVAVDPGLGFAKTAAHNWALLAGLPRLAALGQPVLIGASRKSFLGSLLDDGMGPRPADRRDGATHAVSALAAAAGAWCVRVHEVSGSVDAVRTAAAWTAAVAEAG